MCGMAGYIEWREAKPEHKEIINGIVCTLTHRGPDGVGSCDDGDAVFGHTRLSIIDLHSGAQPLTIIGKRGNKLTITYNGELYNYREIRKQLVARGRQFKTDSDTEVLLCAYDEWGAGSVVRFVGMFAFAIWDGAKRTLFMARDPLGVKPLYYYKTSNGVVFGSEEKAILAHPDVSAVLDDTGVAELFCMVPMTNPNSSILRGILQVRPGHTVTVTEKGIETSCYWRLEALPHNDNKAVTIKKTRALFEEAVHSQMVSDVPIGAMLSGGVDSSAVASQVAYLQVGGKKKLPTYAIDYTSNEASYSASALHVDRDTPWAEKVADHINSEHSTHYVSVADLLRAQDITLHAWDRPSYSPVNVSLYLLFRHIRDSGIHVVLGGEGADEAFAGYRWWRDSEDVTYEGFPWYRTYHSAAYLLNEDLRRRIKPEQYVRDSYYEARKEVPVLAGETKHDRRMREISWMTYTYYLNFLLQRVDRMSMAASVEARVPFCDHRLVQYCWNIPWELKNSGDMEKGIFRYAVEHLLPKDVTWRRKSGYPVAQMAEYQKALWSAARQLLRDKNAPVWQVASHKATTKLVKEQEGNISEWTALNHISYILEMNTWLKKLQIQVC